MAGTMEPRTDPGSLGSKSADKEFVAILSAEKACLLRNCLFLCSRDWHCEVPLALRGPSFPSQVFSGPCCVSPVAEYWA